MDNKKWKILLPLIFAGVLVIGMLLGAKMKSGRVITPIDQTSVMNFSFSKYGKIKKVLSIIEKNYVDSVGMDDIEDQGIAGLLKSLDPHSTYIPKSDLKSATEDLQGNFEGVGIEFYILNDTLLVVSAIGGGPSEAVGIMAGDKIIEIDSENVAGIEITNNKVIKKLKGPKGSKVAVGIFRNGSKDLKEFTITRDKIPINSMDIAYMINETTGYIKLNRFSATTYQEMMEGMFDLKDKGMTNLILDLRGNGGGYLSAATAIVDEFLVENQLIVYTEGRNQPTKKYNATERGSFLKDKLVVLVDEGSASASEIVAGAIQDWDRGTIIGRRSFGKGLVQEQVVFNDGSALRLTVARYYTPTGRSIQKSYDNGNEDYYNELNKRYEKGEFKEVDSIQILDTVKFVTPGGKIVYGGGGIVPDVFVPVDTFNYSVYFGKLFSAGAVNEFAYDYVDKNRAKFKKYASAEEYVKSYTFGEAEMKVFLAFAEKKVPFNAKGYERSKKVLTTQLTALIGRRLYREQGYFPIMNQKDVVIKAALKELEKPQLTGVYK
ncbi:MAG: carboxyl-terminal processing protease [Sphingobacteriales bacterium]|jgi:carboxyl-terminal processing protease